MGKRVIDTERAQRLHADGFTWKRIGEMLTPPDRKAKIQGTSVSQAVHKYEKAQYND